MRPALFYFVPFEPSVLLAAAVVPAPCHTRTPLPPALIARLACCLSLKIQIEYGGLVGLLRSYIEAGVL
ncbi:hypothetical protein D3C72_2425910 [compost metagenome]